MKSKLLLKYISLTYHSPWLCVWIFIFATGLTVAFRKVLLTLQT